MTTHVVLHVGFVNGMNATSAVTLVGSVATVSIEVSY